MGLTHNVQGFRGAGGVCWVVINASTSSMTYCRPEHLKPSNAA